MIQPQKGSIPIDILEEIIALGEGYKTEFKETLPSPKAVAKSLCAFTNTKGGSLFVGINDSGKPTGVLDINSELSKLEEALPLLIPEPEIIVQNFSFKRKEIIFIEVKEGDNKPYYVRDDHGTHAYIRAADINLPATKKILKTFIDSHTLSRRHKRALKKDEKIVFDLFERNKRLHITEIREMLNYSERKNRRILIALTKRGLVVPSYNEKNIYYRTKD